LPEAYAVGGAPAFGFQQELLKKGWLTNRFMGLPAAPRRQDVTTYISSSVGSWDIVCGSVHILAFTFSTQRLDSHICQFDIIVERGIVHHRLCYHGGNESDLYLG
jgi:hypothetical protein